MLGYALLMCLWLGLANAKTNSVTEDSAFTAPEVFDGLLTAWSLSTEETPRLSDTQPLELHAYIYESIILDRGIYDREHQSLRRAFQLIADPGTTTIKVRSFRRLSFVDAAISWYDEKPYGSERHSRVAIINTTLAYFNSSSEFMKELIKVKGNLIMVPGIEEVDIITDVNSGVTCGDGSSQRCRHSYRMTRDFDLKEPRVTKFNVDLDWPTIYVDRLAFVEANGEQNFVVRGFQGNDYKILKMMDKTGEVTELMTLPNVPRHLEMYSSNLTFCWIDKPGEAKYIDCDQFNDQGKSIFKVPRIPVDFVSTLLSVQSDGEGYISMFYGKAHCDGDNDCRKIYVMNLVEGSRPRKRDNHTFDLKKCNVSNRKNIAILWHNDGRSRYSYDCKTGDALTRTDPICQSDYDGNQFCTKTCLPR